MQTWFDAQLDQKILDGILLPLTQHFLGATAQSPFTAKLESYAIICPKALQEKPNLGMIR